MLVRICASLFAITTLALPSARATTIVDPANDFIPTFTGTKSGDLDVLSTFATFNGSSFQIGATLNSQFGTLPTALYVFGFNRGAATSNFGAIGLPNVIFDSVITLTSAGVLGGRDLVTNTAITLPSGAASISGSSFTINVPSALLPSQGLAPLSYGINLWPRDAAAVGGGNAQISDFAPDATDFQASSVPEPYSAALLGMGLLLAAVRRVSYRR